MRICVAMPTGDTIHADTAMCLTRMVAHTISQGGGHEIAIINPRSSIQRGRHTAIKAALEMEADRTLFIDSDMTFPPDTLLRLLAHGKDVVGTVYSRRREPFLPIGKSLDGGTIEEGTGVVEVKALGTGMMMINTYIFDSIPKPYFESPWNDERQDFDGEDYNFCRQVRELGLGVCADLDLSREIGHIGAQVFGLGWK